MNNGIIIAYLGCLIIGIAIGVIITALLLQPYTQTKKQNATMTEERRNELVDRLWDIMDEFELNDNEIASILRQGDIYNEKTAAASNRIAELLLEEDLTVDEGVELFDYCYNSLG
ncbi:MAG: hypothetical protein ACM3YE_12745 [Bacteroidota bacterium]